MKKILSFLTLSMFISLQIIAKNELKTNYRTALVMTYSPTNSVYEDDNIKLEIYDGKLWATNKTDKTIFIDKSQAFAVHNGSSYPMWEKATNEKKASKAKNSLSIDEFISIPPAIGSKQNETFICALAFGIFGEHSTVESPTGDFSEYDERLMGLINELVNESLEADPKGKQYLGTAYRHLTEDESINNIGANLAYAFNKRAEEWNPVAISTWVSDVYFTPFYVEMPLELSKDEKRGFGVKKQEAAKIHLKADSPFEFDQDKSPILTTDWVGNFNKGKFNLYATWIPKKKKMNIFKALGAGLATIATGGLAAALFIEPEDYYKSVVVFDGQNADWGNMNYMKSGDLSQFKNER